MADPEATSAPAQAPVDLKAQAIAEARVELEARESPAPEAVDTGTGDPATAAPTADAPPEVDWSDAAARDAFLAEKYLPKEEHESRLKNQLQSLKGKLTLAEQAEAQKQREALLSELDTLSEDDPDAFVQRLKSDPAAARVLAERSEAVPPLVMQQAHMTLAQGMAKTLFDVVPELEAVAAEGGDAWASVTDPETGGVFGYLTRTSLEQGKAQGVEDFKKSKEYKDALAAAERRGAQNAVGDFTVGTPAPEDAERIATGVPVQKFTDPVRQAAAEAMRELGATIDLSKVRSARVGAR